METKQSDMKVGKTGKVVNKPLGNIGVGGIVRNGYSKVK